MILNKDPGEAHQYGVFIFAVSLGNTSNDDLIMQPDTMRVDGHKCIRFFLGSCLWVFNVSSHSHTFIGREYYLREDGSIIIPKQAAENMHLFQRFAKEVFRKV